MGKKKDRLGESRTGLRLIKQRTQRRRRRRQPLDISGLLLLRTSVWDPEWQEAERERRKNKWQGEGSERNGLESSSSELLSLRGFFLSQPCLCSLSAHFSLSHLPRNNPCPEPQTPSSLLFPLSLSLCLLPSFFFLILLLTFFIFSFSTASSP